MYLQNSYFTFQNMFFKYAPRYSALAELKFFSQSTVPNKGPQSGMGDSVGPLQLQSYKA